MFFYINFHPKAVGGCTHFKYIIKMYYYVTHKKVNAGMKYLIIQ